MNGLWKFSALWMVGAATFLVPPSFGQSSTASEKAKIGLRSMNEPAICGESRSESGVKEALHLVCVRQPIATRNNNVRSAIVIGFVGGFVKHDDMNILRYSLLRGCVRAIRRLGM